MVDSDQLDFLLSSSAGDTLHDQNKTFLGLSSLFQERYVLIYGNRLANALGAGPADLSCSKTSILSPWPRMTGRMLCSATSPFPCV